MAQTVIADLPGALTGSLLVGISSEMKKGEDAAWLSTVVCTTEFDNLQLIMVLHTRGMFPVRRSSFSEKVNFRPAMDKVTGMCWLVCAVQQQFVLRITELRQENPQLLFFFLGCFPGAILYFKLLIKTVMWMVAQAISEPHVVPLLPFVWETVILYLIWDVKHLCFLPSAVTLPEGNTQALTHVVRVI